MPTRSRRTGLPLIGAAAGASRSIQNGQPASAHMADHPDAANEAVHGEVAGEPRARLGGSEAYDA